ncbi:MAG: hypothetical protein ACLFM0_10120 [Spirochaetales bacterium]
MYRNRLIRNSAFACIAGIVLSIAVSQPASASEDLYDSRFLGVSYHFQGYIDSNEGAFSERLSPRGAGMTFTYGFPGVRLPRVRAGIGWEPQQPVYTAVGLEVPLFERFNAANARGVGVFILSDVVLGFPEDPRVSVDTKLVGMLPVSIVGGISLGGGVTHRGEPLLHIGYKTGVFPID